MDARIAVLVSGSGTNLQALLDDPFTGPRIALVVSDRPGVRALDRAAERGVESQVISTRDHPDREAFSAAVRDELLGRDIDIVVSAGYMKVLGATFFDAFAGRFLNVHPALLPAFPGAHAVADALEWGAKATGVTVHLVDEQVDHGPIVFQEAVAIRDDDDWDSLEARIHEVEHRLLPAAVRALVEGRLKVEGRRVHVLGDE
ncbi:MAG TPA: phosphoribosylglycinamide formyltransferase [Actinomycetota bacterium]|jgi:phosphoribosylglycinamide formyltransferase-1|nr:phosphoribosylglycinamide formyltransferase [Actinomycetota bacterium]